MAIDFHFALEDRPGTGARVLSAIADAGINVIGVCAVAGGQEVHLAVEDRDAAGTRRALEGVGVAIGDERPVTVVPVENRPGAGAALLQRLADAGINVDALYLATDTRVILSAANPEAVQQLVAS